MWRQDFCKISGRSIAGSPRGTHQDFCKISGGSIAGSPRGMLSSTPLGFDLVFVVFSVPSRCEQY